MMRAPGEHDSLCIGQEELLPLDGVGEADLRDFDPILGIVTNKNQVGQDIGMALIPLPWFQTKAREERPLKQAP